VAALLGRIERAESIRWWAGAGRGARLTGAPDAFRDRRVQDKAVFDVDGIAARPSAWPSKS